MTGAPHEVGMAVVCDLEGVILEVLRDELDLGDRLAPGRSLSTLVDRGSVLKSLNFLVAVKTHGAAFDWQISVRVSGEIQPLSFAGAVSDGKLTVVAAKTADGLEKLVEQLLKMGNEQINALRSAMKDRSDLAREQARRESALYDELSRLNNELSNLQRELTKRNVELAKLNEEKNRFLGIAAHDLRNPLNAIQMYSEFLLDEAADSLSSEHIEFVSIIHSSSRFMLQLVNDLLDVAKIESGKLVLELEPADIAELVEHNTAINRVMAGKKEIDLYFDADPHIPPLMVDRAKIEQVLNNLITNAVKFSNPGSSVQVRLVKSGEDVILSVKDQGQGIPAEELGKLFQPFQKTRVRSTGGEESTGLGLAIVRKIVNGHGGKVWVESEVGNGSTFFVSLPMTDR
jgi:signal transduction histidine kinase